MPLFWLMPSCEPLYNFGGGLDKATQKNVITALRRTRSIKPGYSNWLLFSGMIEGFFLSIGEEYDPMRLDYAVTKHQEWYKGDGVWGWP